MTTDPADKIKIIVSILFLVLIGANVMIKESDKVYFASMDMKRARARDDVKRTPYSDAEARVHYGPNLYPLYTLIRNVSIPITCNPHTLVLQHRGSFTNHTRGSVWWSLSWIKNNQTRAETEKTVLGRISWQPGIRKCASTELTHFFKHAVKNRAYLVQDHRDQPGDDGNTTLVAKGVFSFTVVRDPLERFLAGVHQLYTMFRMGWLGTLLRRTGAQYWKGVCFNSTFGANHTYIHLRCTNGYSHPVDLIDGVLDDIDRIGFFDEHIVPMSHTIAVSTAFRKESSLLFDIGDVSRIESGLNRVLYSKTNRSNAYRIPVARRMARTDPAHEKHPWVISASDLLKLAINSTSKARHVVQRFCKIYETEYECLPYTRPRMCGPLFRRVDGKSGFSLM